VSLFIETTRLTSSLAASTKAERAHPPVAGSTARTLHPLQPSWPRACSMLAASSTGGMQSRVEGRDLPGRAHPDGDQRYARPGAEAVAALTAATDPARRRR
jgi:hypothetical protein